MRPRRKVRSLAADRLRVEAAEAFKAAKRAGTGPIRRTRVVTETLYTFRQLREACEAGPQTVLAAAVDRARQYLRDSVDEHGWWDEDYGFVKQMLDQIGFEFADVSFSGFHNQGDGASFTASVNLEKLLLFFCNMDAPQDRVLYDAEATKENFIPYAKHLLGFVGSSKYNRLRLFVDEYLTDAEVVRTCSRYSHANTCKFQVDWLAPHEYVPTIAGEQVLQHEHPRLRALITEFREDAESLRVDLCRKIYARLEKTYEYLRSDENLDALCESCEWYFDAKGRKLSES